MEKIKIYPLIVTSIFNKIKYGNEWGLHYRSYWITDTTKLWVKLPLPRD